MHIHPIIQRQNRRSILYATIGLIAVPLKASAQAAIELLEPINGTAAINVGGSPFDALNQYLQPLMPYIIGMSAGLAVFMIILGGMQIMLGGGDLASSGGKDRILAVLAGLLILVFSATILYMLNANFFVLGS